MPFQFELNEVTPLTTHSNYSVEILLDEDFPNTMKMWKGAVAVLEDNDAERPDTTSLCVVFTTAGCI